LDKLIYKAIELQVDACLFGHTHIPALFTHGGIIFLNPGSTVYPHTGTERGYGLLRISDEGEITGKLINYKESAC
jgi:putative phosphoesterase